ncbi:MAG: phosphoglycerate dehydrogenase [Bdellovibrionales bacterium]
MDFTKRKSTSIAVTARAFSQNLQLRKEIGEHYQHVKFNETGRLLSGSELVDFLKGSEAAIISLEKIDEQLLSQLPELRVISKYGVGLDNVNFEALVKHDTKFSWRGGVNRRSVAELTLSFILLSLRKSAIAHQQLRNGVWKPLVGAQLTGRTVGIVGCGFIGRDLVHLLKPFGCKLLAHDIVDDKPFHLEHDIEFVSLDELITRSDIVTLHVPLNTSTKNIMNASRIQAMKENSLLINTARGGLVDETALKARLKKENMSAAFDVFAEEPAQDLELIHLPSFFSTPHMGGSSQEAVIAMGRAAYEGLETALPIREWLEEYPEYKAVSSLQASSLVSVSSLQM